MVSSEILSAEERVKDPSLSLLLGFLDTDSHAAFVLSIQNPESLGRELNLALVHSNPVLQNHDSIRKQLISFLSTTETSERNEEDFQALVSALDGLKDSTGTSTARVPVTICNVRWGVAVVNRQWVVAVQAENILNGTTTKSRIHGSACTESHLANGHVYELTPEPSHEQGEPMPLKRNSSSKPRLGNVSPGGTHGNNSYLQWFNDFDWASSALGAIETWSPQLRQSCEMMLASPDPVALLWSQENILIYNARYAVLKKDKHPAAMGRPADKNWADIWEMYIRAYERIQENGQSIKHENVRRLLHRKDHLEEDYFNFTFIPVLGDDSLVAGVFCYIFETTQQVLAERRIRLLIDIDDSLSALTSIHDLASGLMDVLSGNKSDISFAFFCTLPTGQNPSDPGTKFTLEALMGLEHGKVTYEENGSRFTDETLDRAVRNSFITGKPCLLTLADGTYTERFQERLCSAGLRDSCREVMILPLKSTTDGQVAAVVIFGVNPVRDYDGEYRVFVKLLTEHIENAITAIKSIERERALAKTEAIVESERRIMMFAETVTVGIFMFEPNGAIRFCNKAFQDISGMTPEQISTPMGWSDTVHPDSLAGTAGYWTKISSGEGPFTFEVQYKKAWRPNHDTTGSDGLDRTWGLVHAFPEMSETGELKGIQGSVTDISHHKWAAHMQAERLTEALELKRQQDNFLDMTSHEMRNPLNAIFHCASELIEQLTNQLKQSAPGDSIHPMLTECLDLATTIMYCANHQKRIVDDVLTLSKLDSRLLQIAPLSADPIQVVRQVLSIFESELRASGIEVHLDVLDGYESLCIDSVFLDPHRISQVIINLLSNAVKFTKEKPERHLQLSLDASVTEPVQGSHGLRYVPSGIHRQDPTVQPDWGHDEIVYLTFLIRDTGAGMTPDEAKILFNRFTQASPRTHVQYGGTGLGLFISRELAEMHGGQMGLSSEPGVGSTFGFFIKTRRTAPRSDTSLQRSLSALLSLESMGLAVPSAERIFRRQSSDDTRRKSISTQLTTSSATKLLVVEDNIINQRLLKKLMVKHGYEVCVANHGEEALMVIQSSTWCLDRKDTERKAVHIDLVLCDIEMPVMDGKTCVRTIRLLQEDGLLDSKIPVVAVTGNARREQVSDAKECGFDAVVAKPYKITELIEVIEETLHSYRDDETEAALPQQS